jgi:5,5'-dehydrodivanillate O-demethylase
MSGARMDAQEAAPPLAPIDVTRTGPDTLAGQYLRRFWLPVALLEDVKPGRAKPIRVLHEHFTYYRGESGRPHLVGFRCAHRGTQLSTGRVEGENLSCFYHGWTYDETGQCVAQPAEAESFARKVQIPGYPTRDYLGLVFAYLGGGAPPAFPRLATFERPGLIEAKSHLRTTSFFNQLENSVDQVHFNFVHKYSAFGSAGTNRELPAISGEETEYGILRHALYSDGKDRISHILMPITMFSKVFDPEMGWTDHLGWRVPVDDNRHITFMVDLIEKTGAELDRYLEQRAAREQLLATLPPAADIVAAILRGELHIDDMGDRPDLLALQDDVALNAQLPMSERPPDRLGRSDVQVILLRKIWTRELQALAAGAPLKNWNWPANLSVATGV